MWESHHGLNASCIGVIDVGAAQLALDEHLDDHPHNLQGVALRSLTELFRLLLLNLESTNASRVRS